MIDQDGKDSHVKTFAASPASRAAGVMMVFSPTRIFSPFFTAVRTSSSHTKAAGFAAAFAGTPGSSGASRPTGSAGSRWFVGVRRFAGSRRGFVATAPPEIPRAARN